MAITSWKTGVAVALITLSIHVLNDFMAIDGYLPPATINATVEEHFTNTYYESRALFRHRVKEANAELHTLPLDQLSHLDLTIDVAIIAGSKEHVMIHISGTHGVEGFAGSAIQSAILQHHAKWKKDGGPTVILVHALNAYGFARLRRFNENNVDLNRNWLSPEKFRTLVASDVNAFGYMDVYDILNPPPEASWKEIYYWPRAAYYIATKGFAAIKQAIVSGNYHLPQGVFFCGQEKQPSLILLEKFLKEHVAFESISSLRLVDVHTGLGKSGQDTLILVHGCNQDLATKVFADESSAGNVASLTDDTNPVTRGYSTVTGFVLDGITELVPSDRRSNIIATVQEFGTVPGVFILKALSAENAYYHHAPSRRLPFAEKVRDVFYVHRSFSWKQSVLERGLTVFYKHYNNQLLRQKVG